MGRGLSPLQKKIMEIADREGSVDTSDVLKEYYRLIPARLLNHRQRVQAYDYRWSLYEKPEFGILKPFSLLSTQLCSGQSIFTTGYTAAGEHHDAKNAHCDYNVSMR